MNGLVFALCALGLPVIASAAPSVQRPGPADSLVVHEWGTFTSFQDHDGATIAGINVDDEPVPEFVHRLTGLHIYTNSAHFTAKGVATCHKDVTLRLETPVLYFYPGTAFPGDQSIDVTAAFPAGWLTEFFPRAKATAPGFPAQLTAATRGTLAWSDLTLANQGGKLTTTSEAVWLAPRNVRAAAVTTANRQETEKYLFYRGVGHLDAPLVIKQAGGAVSIAMREQSTLDRWPQSWLVRVGSDGRVWYRALSSADAKNGAISVSLANATATNLRRLRTELARGLIDAGLFEDEAQAMLDTWQQSYFASAGLRLFFLLPQAWTDAHLPLTVSVPAETTRVMMGRIELISEEQQAALRALYALPDAALNVEMPFALFFKGAEALSDQQRQARWSELMSIYGSKPSLSDAYRAVGHDVPEAAQLYDQLGRFRDPLLGHEYATTSDPAVRQRIGRIMSQFSSCVTLPQES
ncbi:MAG TPA: hypothetical protein VKB34_04680 [Povalibacter sp.]|nr:hypothetical protein [Povalibacter sp.]